MAARMWFTAETCPDLPSRDRAILNRAARNGWGNQGPNRLELMELRMAYKSGMSANDLLEAVKRT